MKRILGIATFGAALVLMPLIALASPAKYQLGVDGLACPFCAYGIEKKLKATEGVKDIDIDIDGGIVTVTMVEGATMTEEQARRIVDDAGFTLRDFAVVKESADATKQENR